MNPRHTRLESAAPEEIPPMKAFALGFGLLILGLFNSSAATETRKTSDESAVRSTVTNYIESYYSGDANRMERSLHPHYLKHTISRSDGKLSMTEWTGLQMIQEVRSRGAVNLPASEKTEQITVLDIADGMASAKLVTPHWVDYLTLSKWNGEWKIVSVVLTEID
jgi:Putative lumazine-binding